MRRKLWLVTVVSLLLLAPLWAQDGNKAKLLGTHHDFSASNTDQELCGYCHIPHALNSDTTVRTLLWNHQIGSTASYQAYSSATLNATDIAVPTDTTGPAFYSLACLSCHDGQTAVNVVYRIPYSSATGAGTGGGAFGTDPGMGDQYKIGTDLRNDHPVNFTYDAALATADGGLFSPTGGTGPTPVRAKTTTTDGDWGRPILFDNKMQCASCHNPHNDTNAPFLRVANTKSKLCRQCHDTSTTDPT